jgi:hypothetical protein
MINLRDDYGLIVRGSPAEAIISAMQRWGYPQRWHMHARPYSGLSVVFNLIDHRNVSLSKYLKNKWEAVLLGIPVRVDNTEPWPITMPELVLRSLQFGRQENP